MIADYFVLPLTDASKVRVARPYPPSVAYHVWQNGAKQSTANIALTVFSLPSALTTADAVTGEYKFTTAAKTETKSVSTTASSGDSAGARTIAVPLPADLPNFCADGCAATLHLYPARFPSKEVRLPIQFFNYKRPAVKSVFPLEGSEQGDSLVSLTVEDYQGDASTPSRVMAGLFSFFSAPALQVSLSCAGKAVQVQGASLKDTGNSQFLIKFAAPPCAASVANYTLATSSGNVVLDLGGFKALQFTYKGTVVSSVTPPSGMTNPGSTGVDISIFIDNVQTAPATTPTVTLAGAPCVVSLATFSPGNNQLLIKARTPELAVALAGRVGVGVSGVVAGSDLAFEWGYTAPPAMFLEAESFTIDGDARTWVSASNGGTVQIACVIRNLHAKYDRAFDLLTLDIPQAGTRTVSLNTLGETVRASFTLDTSTLWVGTIYSVRVGVWKDGVSRFNVSAFDLGARTGAWLEARDTSLPRLLAAAPTEAPAQGGTLLFIGFLEAGTLQEQYAAGAVSFALRHDSGSGVTEVNGTVEHVISLSDYNARGSLYDAAVSKAGQFSQASESLFSAYLAVPAALNMEVLLSADPTQATSDAALLLVRSPLVAEGEKGRVSWLKGGAMQYHDFDCSVIAAPVGTAVVEEAYTDDLSRSSGLSGNVLLTIVVSNFPLVYSKASLTVKFGDTSAKVLRLLEGSSSGTRFTVLVPAGSPGVVDVTVAGKDFPSNAATFQFTYIDNRIPQASSFSPARVYADGGHTVTVLLTDFPDVQAASEVSAVATAADGTQLTFAVVSSAKSAAGVTTVVLSTTAGAAGNAAVVIYTSTQNALPFSLDLVAVPTGAPLVKQLTPSIGECRAGSPVTVSMRLDSFRAQTDASHLRVTFGGNSTTPRKVSSFMTGTSFEFASGVEDLDGGVYEVRVWSSTDPSKVAVSTFTCKDTTVATLVGAFPASGFAGSNTAVSVFLIDSGYTLHDTVFLKQDGVTTAVANAAKGGSPMEVLLTLTATVSSASSMTLAPCKDPTKDANCLKKEVSFDFNFLDPDAVRVTGFFPLSEYVSGRTKVDVAVKNLPANLVNSQVILDFGASNATCKSSDTATGVLTFEIPTEPTATAGAVSLRLHLLASGESFNLPKTFDYLEQKPAVITSVSPSKASIRAAATARVAVRNLPGTDAASDIAVQLVWSDGRTLDLLVLSVTRRDVRKQVYEVQEWFADVTTPVDPEPDDADSIEGAVTVRVIHRVFGAFVELQAGLTMYDDALPQVMSVLGPDGAGQTSANVPMSVSSEVTITVNKSPAGVKTSVYSAVVGSSAVGVTFATVDAARMAQVVLTSPSQESAGELYGLIVFGAAPASCVSACCEAASCVVDCPGVFTACFSLLAYDDLVPIASVKSAVSGPEIGGSFILVSIAKFPLLFSAADAEVSFGEVAGSLQLKSSSAKATVLTLVTPEYTTLGTASSALVDVTVTPKKQPDRAIVFQYTYVAVSPAVTAFTPASGLNDVVLEVKVQIAYLPFPGTVLVTFGGEAVSSTVHPSSNKMASLVIFNTRAGLLGTIPVVIKPKLCLDPCVDQVQFTFKSLDATVPELLAPPSGMAKQQPKLPKITLEKFPAEGTYSSLLVTMVASDKTELACTVQTVDRMGDLTQLDVLTPAALRARAAGTYSVRIQVTNSGGLKTVTITSFVVYDGMAAKVVSYGPAVVPTVASAGGRLLQLQSRVSATMANFPQGLSLASVVATLGAENVKVLQVTDLVKCSAVAIDCNRTRVTLLAPALASPGDKTFSVSAPGMSVPLTFAITFEPPCDFQALCAAKSQLVNYRRLLDAPTIECDPAYCIKATDISVPEILRVSPSEGLVVGGTLVTLQVARLPAFSAADIKVVAGEGVTKAFGEVVKFTQEPGSSLTSSKGELILRTPAVDALSELVEFTVSTKLDSESRSAKFVFDYLPALSGATTFVQVSPASMYETTVSDTVSIALSLGNVPRLKRPFVLSDIMVKVGAGAFLPVSKITSSDRDRTTVNVEIKGHPALPAGTLKIRAYSVSRGIATAGVRTVNVTASPAPSVVGAYPSDGSTDLSHSVAVTVQYVPPAMQLAGLTAAQLVTSEGRTYRVEILSVANKNSKCLHTYCSLFEVKFRAPALNETDNGGGEATFSAHNAAGNMFSWPFKYVASGEPEVAGFSPKWQYVVSDEDDAAATSRNVTIFLKNFPRPGCKDTLACKADAVNRQTRVRFSRVSGDVDVTPSASGMTETAGMLSIQVLAPPRAVAGVDALTVRADAEGVEGAVETGVFSFEYVAPPRIVSPVDGSVQGGTEVTVKAYGLDPIPAQSEVRVTIFDGTTETSLTSANVLAVTGNAQAGLISEMTLSLLMPAFTSAGVFTCRIKRVGASPVVLTEFLFEYFNPPVFSNLEQGDATVKGQTAAKDGVSTALRVSNFPAIAAGADVSVTFGSQKSYVLSFTNFKGGVWLQVMVPPAKDLSPGVVTLSVQYVGAEAIPRGGVTGQTYVRAPKVASVDFSYYVPQPEMLAVRWCEFCPIPGRTCLVNGRCLNGLKPKENSAPLRGVGTLTLVLRNMPAVPHNALTGLLDANALASVSASLGSTSVASLSRVVFQDGDLSAFELSMPSASAGEVLAEMVVQPADAPVPTTASFTFSFFDDNIALACVECRAPSSSGAPFRVTITNFLISTALAASDQITVTFGSEAAAAVTILSSNGTLTVLMITPPSYECASCSYAGGVAAVELAVVSRTDASRGASSPFTFWTAPVVSTIAMDQLGLQLVVTFDHSTNRASMSSSDRSCGQVFADETAFAKMSGSTALGGSAPTCVWATALTLNVFLGVGATLVPGDALTLTPGVVRSANLVSLYSSSAATSVAAPEFLKEPSLSVSGPTTIDQCSLLNLKAASDSPRPPDFAWSCLNHDGLNAALRAFTTSQVDLASGTPEMTDLDTTYEIGVTATDMFGSVSKLVVFKVFKASAPAPQLYFQPASVAVTRDLVAEVRAVTVFSQCTDAKSEMLFQWAQISGPTTIPAQYLGTISQLRIPGGTLAATATYVVSLTVSMSDDVSKQSSSQMVISVGRLPLIARIKGSASRKQSTRSALLLDASVSSDPDVNAGAAPGLAFAWACTLSDGTSSQSCRDTTGALLVFGNASILQVPADMLPATTDAPYQFTVTASKAGKSPATYTLSLTLVTQDIPNVELAVYGEFFRQKDGSIKINENSVFLLTASCITTSPKTQSWGGEVALTAPAFTASMRGDSLIYKGDGSNALVAGASYVMTSSCKVVGALETVVGSAEQVVVVNLPPAGVPCETCLVDGDDTKCVKAGEPVFDLLRISCANWADSDGGLEYRFGYQVEGDDNIVEFDWKSSPSLDMRLPTGTINLAAQVRDKLGALSVIMSSTVEIGAGGGGRRRLLASPSDSDNESYSDYIAGGRRLLMQSSFNWPGAAALLDGELLGGNYDPLNNMASALILEVDSQYSGMNLTAAESLAQKDVFFTKLESAAVAVNNAASMSAGYMCTSLNLASTISSNPAHLSTALVARLLDHVTVLVSDEHLSVASITTSCASSALSFMSNALAATKHGNVSNADLASVVTKVERGLMSVLRETAAGLVEGAASVASSNSSSTAIARNTYAGRAWAAASLTTQDLLPEAVVSYAMPSTFENDAGLGVLKNDAGLVAPVDIFIGAFFSVPAFGGVAPIGPLVTLLVSQNGGHVPVANLSESINISIPFTAAHRAVGGKGKCVYVNGSAFSDAGVTTIQNGDAGVICQTTHLTSFTVVETTTSTTSAAPDEVTTTTADDDSASSTEEVSGATANETAISTAVTTTSNTTAPEMTTTTTTEPDEEATGARRGSSASRHREASSDLEASTGRANRRLLAGSITVTCEVDAASVSEANVLSQRLTSGLVENLKNKGLPGATVLASPEVVTRVKKTTQGLAVETSPLSSDALPIVAIAVGAGVGALCLTVLVLGYVFYKRRGSAEIEAVPAPLPATSSVSAPTCAAVMRASVAERKISCEASARPHPVAISSLTMSLEASARPAVCEGVKPGVAAGATLVSEGPRVVKDSLGELHVVRAVPTFAEIPREFFAAGAGPSLSPGDTYREKMSSAAATIHEGAPGLATVFNEPTRSDAPAAGSIAAAIAAALARVRAPEGGRMGWGGRGGPRAEEADSTMMARGFASTSVPPHPL
ncbi:hypothetical protein T484DRAFT_1835196 [Baffinella frigidus]|nr:hypothetical protein T484DRAFT_1835196 [Cryptophyta sp. CCMP2293]